MKIARILGIAVILGAFTVTPIMAAPGQPPMREQQGGPHGGRPDGAPRKHPGGPRGDRQGGPQGEPRQDGHRPQHQPGAPRM